MAKRSTRTETTAQWIRKRILHGDHALNGLSGERHLAAEFGVSRETLRNALEILESEGVLLRQPNGRLTVATGLLSGGTKRMIGVVKQSCSSHDHQIWSEAVREALDGRNCTLRTLTFEHYGDVAIANALSGFDGMFFLPPGEPIPGWLCSKIKDSPCKVVVLDQDETVAGLRSVLMFPAAAQRKLLDHLAFLGHRHIDCLNTQAMDRVIDGRIDCWRSFLSANHFQGELHTLTESSPIASAYRLTQRRLAENRVLPTALVCTTGPAAIGAMRAFFDAGIRVGTDISIAAVNDEGFGPYLVPSLTCLQTPRRSTYLNEAVRWMLQGQWDGPLLVQPEEACLFIGDSTGPVPGHRSGVLSR